MKLLGEIQATRNRGPLPGEPVRILRKKQDGIVKEAVDFKNNWDEV